MNQKRKNGFTLIELLAVIVILAIIALIAVPVIMNIINKANKSAFKDTAYGVIQAGELYFAEQQLELNGMQKNVEIELPDERIQLKGSVPEGKVMITRDGKVSIAVKNDRYCITKGLDDTDVTVTENYETCDLPGGNGGADEGVSLSTLVDGMAVYDASADTWYANDEATLTGFGLDTAAITYSTAGLSNDFTVADADRVLYEDYEYRYNYVISVVSLDWVDNATESSYFGEPIGDGWGVSVLDRTKTSYKKIADTLFDEPVKNLYATFALCENLTNVPEIPNNVTSLAATFAMCSKLVSVVLPDNLTRIGTFTFSSCSSLTSIDIPDTVTSLGEGAFSGCTSLKSIDIPDTVTSLGESVFADCSGLTSIDIPDKVTHIPAQAFNGCSGLTSLFLHENIEDCSDNAFGGCTNLKTLYILNPNFVFGPNATGGVILDEVYFNGTEEQFAVVKGRSDRDCPKTLENATIYYNYIP